MSPWETFKNDYTGKKVLIFGLGVQGRGVGDAKIFAQLGAQVTVTDLKTADQLQTSLNQLSGLPITYHLGGHPADILNGQEVVIRNASIPWNHPLLQEARKRQIPIKMDESLFFTYAKPTKSIGITGTRGKSTTTALVYELLTANGLKTILAGNLVPNASLSLLPNFDPDAWYVFELSSWQLQGFHQEKISPHIAIVTNIYEDHLLDRTLEEYAFDKQSIFLYQQSSDLVLLNQDNPGTKEMASKVTGQLNWFSSHDLPADLSLRLPGEHNRENAAAAIKLGHLLNLATVEPAVSDFGGVPYRLEKVATINDVSIVNDTTSTTPIACIKALETYPGSIIIMGGTSKHLPTKDLIETVNRLAAAIILLPGTGTEEIKPYISPALVKAETADLKVALDTALSLASPGKTILFSPGFTSFGLFTNEFQRGEVFNQVVGKVNLP